MPSFSIDVSAATLTSAITDNLFAWYRYYATSPAAEWHESALLTWVLTPVRHPYANSIVRTRLTSESADRVIADTLMYFRSRGVTRLCWWVESDSEPADLATRLAGHGLTYCDGASGMAMDLSKLREEPIVSTNYVVQAVADSQGFNAWVEALAVCHGLDEPHKSAFSALFEPLGFDLPLRHYVGMLRGRPVATAQLFLGAGVAGIYFIATAPEVRRQGIGRTTTLAPLRDARAMGYRIAIVHASPDGLSMYQRFGFRELRRMPYFEWYEARLKSSAVTANSLDYPIDPTRHRS